MTLIRSGIGNTFSVLTLVAVLGACGKGTDAARAAAKGAQAPAAVAGNAASPSTDLGGARMHLEITGGAHAGKFDRTMEAAGCMYGMSGPAAWHLSWDGGDPGDPNSLNIVTLDVPNLKATENGATPFALQVFFGSNENSTAFGFNTIASAGGRAGGEGNGHRQRPWVDCSGHLRRHALHWCPAEGNLRLRQRHATLMVLMGLFTVARHEVVQAPSSRPCAPGARAG